MDGKIGSLRMGTCSWNYGEWPIYSAKKKGAADYLAEYSRVFNTAEIDSWFYRPPDEATVREYDLNTPQDFIFTAKVPSILTRPVFDDMPSDYFLNPEIFNQFVKTACVLGKKLGVLILQFEYMNLLKMAGLEFFLLALERFLDQADRTIPLAIETRNGNYLTPKYFKFLEDNKLIPVFSQKIYMPNIWTIWKNLADHKPEKVVIRLLGDDRQEIEKKAAGKWTSIIDEKSEKPEIVDMLNQMRQSGIDIFLNINNHYEGSAIESAQYFRRELFLKNKKDGAH